MVWPLCFALSCFWFGLLSAGRCHKYLGTVHGAYLSGIRAADEILGRVRAGKGKGKGKGGGAGAGKGGGAGAGKDAG